MLSKKSVKSSGILGRKPLHLDPHSQWWVDLPGKVVQVVSYRVESKKYPKWKFWRNEVVKYNIAALQEDGRLFVIDPDNFTIIEKNNKHYDY